MPESCVELEWHEGVATVWMNRPQRHNAMDETLIIELTRAFCRLDADARVRVIVLAGRGKSFSAGADLDWMRRAACFTPEQNLKDARALAAMFRTIYQSSKPTLARIHGAALGGGTGLIAVCDIAVASTQSFFATSEVRFGIVPGAISPYLIQAIGARNASRYFLTGERIEALEACRIGLIHEVCAPEALDQRILAIAAELSAGGPRAQTAAKQLIRTVSSRALDEALGEYTAQFMANIRTSPEAREGIAAFLDKRKPQWFSG